MYAYIPEYTHTHTHTHRHIDICIYMSQLCQPETSGLHLNSVIPQMYAESKVGMYHYSLTHACTYHASVCMSIHSHMHVCMCTYTHVRMILAHVLQCVFIHVCMYPCHLGWRTLLKCNKTNHACLPACISTHKSLSRLALAHGYICAMASTFM
jgi:hypothetical protein